MGSSIPGKGTLDYLQPEAQVKGTAEGWLFFFFFLSFPGAHETGENGLWGLP